MKVIQIGVTALREPDGTPKKAIPLYINIDEAQDAGLIPISKNEDREFTDVAGLFAKKHKEYIAAVKAAEREIKNKPSRFQTDL